MGFILVELLYLFLDEFENYTKLEIDTPNFGGYTMLARNLHV